MRLEISNQRRRNKMKKAIAAMLALGMTLTMCGGTLVVRAEGDAKTYKVLSGSGEGVAAYDVFNAVVTKYQEEVNPEFNVEYEVISANFGSLAEITDVLYRRYIAGHFCNQQWNACGGNDRE